MITRRSLVVCALGLASLTVAGGLASPQEPGAASPQAPAIPAGEPPQGQQPTFRGGVDFVRVDVVVTDRQGKPVLDLAPGDFEIREDGKPRTIEQFRVIEIDGNPSLDAEPPRAVRTLADEEIEAQREDVRIFAFFLDDYHVRRANAIVVREPLVRFIRTQLRPNDMVGVMYPLTPVNDVLFTRDHDSVIRAIETFDGRKYEYDARNEFERNYERESTEVVERIRNDVVLGALEALAQRMGGLREGRKSVVFVSEGLMTLLPPQMRRMNAQAPQLPIPTTTDDQIEAMAEIDARNRMETRLREVYRAANRNNASIYALDPRGLAAFEFDISDGGGGGAIGMREDQRVLRATQDTLRALAEETDGRAIVNRNTLGEGLAEMVRDASFYYLLGYTSQVPSDGKFHELDVRVKRSGITVRARRGFWAPSEENIQQLTAARARPATPQPVLQALATLSPAIQAARFVRTWVGTDRGSDGRTRVSLVWEPLPVQAGVRREQAGAVAVLALDEGGDLVFRGRSEAAGGGAARGRGAAAAPGGTGAQQIVFEAAPGSVDVRLSIEAAGGGTIDTETRRIEVPDLSGGTVALSTPRVFRGRTAVELRGIAADGSAVPITAREFSRTERLLLRFDVYGPGSERPVPTAALLGRNGDRIGDVPITAAQAGGTHQIEMGLNSMAAGDYVIEISVEGAAGDSATELVPFRLGA